MRAASTLPSLPCCMQLPCCFKKSRENWMNVLLRMWGVPACCFTLQCCFGRTCDDSDLSQDSRCSIVKRRVPLIQTIFISSLELLLNQRAASCAALACCFTGSVTDLICHTSTRDASHLSRVRRCSIVIEAAGNLNEQAWHNGICRGRRVDQSQAGRAGEAA